MIQETLLQQKSNLQPALTSIFCGNASIDNNFYFMNLLKTKVSLELVPNNHQTWATNVLCQNRRMLNDRNMSLEPLLSSEKYNVKALRVCHSRKRQNVNYTYAALDTNNLESTQLFRQNNKRATSESYPIWSHFKFVFVLLL